MYQGSVAGFGHSTIIRHRCRRVIKPNTAPVVVTYDFMGSCFIARRCFSKRPDRLTPRT